MTDIITQKAEYLFIKVGNTRPFLRYLMEPADEIDLTNATVTFSMRDATTKVVIIDNAPAVIIRAKGKPTVEFRWGVGQTDLKADYEGDFKITYLDGTNETVPSRGYIAIVIGDNAATSAV